MKARISEKFRKILDHPEAARELVKNVASSSFKAGKNGTQASATVTAGEHRFQVTIHNTKRVAG